jgi:hypothetical protein
LDLLALLALLEKTVLEAIPVLARVETREQVAIPVSAQLVKTALVVKTVLVLEEMKAFALAVH